MMGPERTALKATGSSATGAGPKKKARVSTEKRVSLSETINHIATEDDETIFQMLAEYDEDIEISEGCLILFLLYFSTYKNSMSSRNFAL